MSDEKTDLSRRSFLKVASSAALATGCSPKAPVAKLYPYLTPPEDIIPGTPVFYRSVCRDCSAGCGLTARSREGRVIKLEGNPEDPVSGGALCARGQSSLQRLYSPQRLKGPMQRDAQDHFTPLSWEDAIQKVTAQLTHLRDQKQGDRIRFLTRPEPGSAGALQAAFLHATGAAQAQRLVFDPLDPAPLRAAGLSLFGREELPGFELAKARSVVSFGADFLETWISPVELSRGFAAGRGKMGPERTRFTWVGPRLAATGASADRWLSARAGSEPWVALELLRWITDPANAVPDLAPEAAAIFASLGKLDPAAVERMSGIPKAQLAAVGRELAQRRPSALLGPGPASTGEDASRLAAAVQLINYVLGNISRTVLYGVDPRLDPPSPQRALQYLADDIQAGKVDLLFLHHPALGPWSPQELALIKALSKVELVVSFSDQLDAATRAAHLVLPDSHALESFGDVSTRKGVVQLCQPGMTPLNDTRMAGDVLLQLAKGLGAADLQSFDDFYAYSQDHVARAAQPGTPDPAQRAKEQWAALERGGYFSPAPAEPVKLNPGALKDLVPPRTQLPTLALVPFPTVRQPRGGEERPWLQELPDLTSTVTWKPWVEISEKLAGQLHVQTGEILELVTSAGRARLPAYVYPRLRDDALAIPLGAPQLVDLLPLRFEGKSGVFEWSGVEISARATGQREELPRISVTPEPHGGELVKTVPPREGIALPVIAEREFYGEPEHPVHRWAMAIDLDRCTGCQACVVACYAENNVPVMGPQFVSDGRSMAWLRIQRYFPEEGDGLQLLPMLCQQCSNAPCEPVCPVYATYHTQEGLNAQVYNRCVGTRYCSNNCPYKVRTFNYKDPVFESPLNLQLNPEVTVRAKGVMEKCTFCVQRIRAAENQAKNEQRPIRDGDVTPACAQTCPGHAIVFGDADDPHSRVHALQRSPRGYHVLGELNTKPAITYLARLREERS